MKVENFVESGLILWRSIDIRTGLRKCVLSVSLAQHNGPRRDNRPLLRFSRLPGVRHRGENVVPNTKASVQCSAYCSVQISWGLYYQYQRVSMKCMILSSTNQMQTQFSPSPFTAAAPPSQHCLRSHTTDIKTMHNDKLWEAIKFSQRWWEVSQKNQITAKLQSLFTPMNNELIH